MRAGFRTGSEDKARVGCASLVAVGDRLYTSGLVAEAPGTPEAAQAQ